MALRSLLRRIPGPRMGPGHGISPPAASRFVGTRSEGEPRTVAEMNENLSRLQKSIKVRLQQSFEEQNKLHKELDEIQKNTRLRMDERDRALNNLRKLGDATIAVMVAIPVLLFFGSKYQA